VHGPDRHNGCVITEAGLAAAAQHGPAAAAPSPAGQPGGLEPGNPAPDGLAPDGLASVASAAELALARLAVRIGADRVAGWSAAEQRLADEAESGPRLAGARPPAARAGLAHISGIRGEIEAGGDPLGEAFCRVRPATQRRSAGQTFTPAPVVAAMVGWAARTLEPARVVDPGTGSARFLAAAGRRWPAAILIGVESDPLAAMIGRATLAAAGLAGRSDITLGDYRSLCLPPAPGPTLFLGNPPYVRHHQIPARWKQWLKATAAGQGLAASGLAGLHVYFLLATAGLARPGDAGVLITAAEWLDVNYGALVRALLLGALGGQSIHLLDPTLPVFSDVITTAAISCFRPGTRPARLRLQAVTGLAGLADLAAGRPVPRKVLAGSGRWTPLFAGPVPRSPAGARPARPAGLVELGELCRVHRGQVTGANSVWITTGNPAGLPARFLFPAVTRARELFAAKGTLATVEGLRQVIDLPVELGGLAASELEVVARFLAAAEAAGAAGSYVSRHRTPWWRVRLRAPAPIIATYMARQPPAFVRNLAGARHVNIAHGLYPREPLPAAALDGLAAYLRGAVTTRQGRTYAGGLTKFEPGELARLLVPVPHDLPLHAPAGT
jgi:adenine-specific DNA-methyltransferase